MSFVVEIPSIFTQSTQIPNRLGNTTLVGNETIHGGLVVNGSLTLGGTDSNFGEPVYESIKVNNELVVDGDTTLQDVSAQNLYLSGNANIKGDLNVKGFLDIDTTLYFDTLVIRRLAEETNSEGIVLNEIQVWANGSNILPTNSTDLNAMFVDWDLDKTTPLTLLEFEDIVRTPDRVYNDEIEFTDLEHIVLMETEQAL